GGEQFVGAVDLVHRQHLRDLEGIPAGTDPLHQAVQAVPAGADPRDPRGQAALGGGGDVRQGRQRDDQTALGDLIEAGQEGGVIVGVQDDVHAAAVGGPLEFGGPVRGVVGDRGGAEVTDAFGIGLPAGGPHLGGAGLERHRDEQLAHSAAAAV